MAEAFKTAEIGRRQGRRQQGWKGRPGRFLARLAGAVEVVPGALGDGAGDLGNLGDWGNRGRQLLRPDAGGRHQIIRQIDPPGPGVMTHGAQLARERPGHAHMPDRPAHRLTALARNIPQNIQAEPGQGRRCGLAMGL